MKRKDDLETKTIAELVRLYQSGPGAEDAVGPEIKRRGIPARDELIRMLDAVPEADRDGDTADTITELLELKFPSAESLEALERFHARDAGPHRWTLDLRRATVLRAKLNGAMDEAWRNERRRKAPAEAHLHYEETLLANALPDDRLEYLVAAVRAALKAWRAARQAGDAMLESADQAKIEAYAGEILATPGLAAKSGDGVYFANHALGILALARGDVETAKQRLMEASKTPGSFMLNRVPGPNWSLALALVERGEGEIVCEFLDNVKLFMSWPSAPALTRKDALIDRWKKEIRSGRKPTVDDWVNEWFGWKAKRRR